MKFGQYLYKCLPSVYRVRDQEVNYTLKRYLDALGESLDSIEKETHDILTLLDVEKMEARFLPFYASMFGLTYDYDVPEDFQRRLLAHIVEMYRRKGTKAVIEFVARELTGMEATVREGHKCLFKTWTDKPNNDIVDNYMPPKTFNKGTGEKYYFYSDNEGSRTSRFIVNVILSSKDLDSSDIFLNTQLISRYTAQLVQPYIRLIYRAFGLQYSDERIVSNIQEEDNTIIIDRETLDQSKKIRGIEVYSRIKSEDNLAYSSDMVDKPLDKLKLLKMEMDGINNNVEYEQDTMRITTKLSDIINLSIDKDWVDHIRDINNPELVDVTIQITKDTFTTKANDILDIETTLEYSNECVQSSGVSDIINLSQIDSDFTDTIKEL